VSYCVSISVIAAIGGVADRGLLQRQWPMAQTAAVPAAAPITNQSALRRRRCQKVPPFAVAIAASRSLVSAFNFVALSVESCLAAAN
jgi:hypothetical protein